MMDLTAARLNSLADTFIDHSIFPTSALYTNGFSSAMPAPMPTSLNLSKNSLSSHTVPSVPLDFSSVTRSIAPPGSPFSCLGGYTPSTTNSISPMYDPGYLKRLQNNPMFRDLQSLLLQECLQMQVPANLITTSWNLMQLHKTTSSAPATASSTQESIPTTSVLDSGKQVFMQHMQLQDKLLKVRIDASVSADGLTVEKEYSAQVGHIEMGRYYALQSCPHHTVKTAINSFFDKERIALISSTEVKLDKLLNKAETIRLAAECANRKTQVPVVITDTASYKKRQPSLQGGSLLLKPVDPEPRYSAARQLIFSNPSIAEAEDDDYLNCSVNSEDFDVVIDVENVDTDSESSVRPCSQNSIDQTSTSSVVIPCVVLPNSRTADSPESLLSNNVSDTDTTADKSIPDPFQTPRSIGKGSTFMDQINANMSALDKLCGGPSISFTPELRSEVTSTYISDTNSQQECSPLRLAMRAIWGDSDECVKHPCSSSKKRKSSSDSENVPSTTERQSNNNSNHTRLPMLKTHRMLSDVTTQILSQWYEQHIQYPYPSDEEIQQLAFLTKITTKQVKKWMANKRVRCYNTLSITGNQHPIKFKQQKRKRRQDNFRHQGQNTTADEKKTGNHYITEQSRQLLVDWYNTHIHHPYPSEEEKQDLASRCEITVSQVKSWFANKRNRTNNTKRQVPNYFIKKFPEYAPMVDHVGQQREEARLNKRRKVNECQLYI